MSLLLYRLAFNWARNFGVNSDRLSTHLLGSPCSYPVALTQTLSSWLPMAGSDSGKRTPSDAKKNKDNVKFKVRCSGYLYTLVITDKKKAEKLKQPLPPVFDFSHSSVSSRFLEHGSESNPPSGCGEFKKPKNQPSASDALSERIPLF
eukprot:bmy_02961T0